MKSKLILLGLCCALVACGSSNSNSSPKTPSSPDSSLTNATIVGPSTMGVGDLVVYSLDKNISNIKWVSSDSKIVEINSRGEAIAWKEGVVTISVLDANGTPIHSIEVKVENKIKFRCRKL